MNLGYFPDTLKIANVVPIYKAGDKTSISNYRPISVLNSLSKIFEKILAERLTNYLMAKNPSMTTNLVLGKVIDCNGADYSNQSYHPSY